MEEFKMRKLAKWNRSSLLFGVDIPEAVAKPVSGAKKFVNNTTGALGRGSHSILDKILSSAYDVYPKNSKFQKSINSVRMKNPGEDIDSFKANLSKYMSGDDYLSLLGGKKTRALLGGTIGAGVAALGKMRNGRKIEELMKHRQMIEGDVFRRFLTSDLDEIDAKIKYYRGMNGSVRGGAIGGALKGLMLPTYLRHPMIGSMAAASGIDNLVKSRKLDDIIDLKSRKDAINKSTFGFLRKDELADIENRLKTLDNGNYRKYLYGGGLLTGMFSPSANTFAKKMRSHSK